MKIIETDMDLMQWFADAEGGDRCEYHRGSLAHDRFSGPARERVSAVADTAWGLERKRLVHLVQQRVDNGFSYQAIARKKPALFAGDIKE